MFVSRADALRYATHAVRSPECGCVWYTQKQCGIINDSESCEPF